MRACGWCIGGVFDEGLCVVFIREVRDVRMVFVYVCVVFIREGGECEWHVCAMCGIHSWRKESVNGTCMLCVVFIRGERKV